MKYTFINANVDLGIHLDGASKGPSLITSNFKDYPVININQANINKEKNSKNKIKNLPAVNEFNKRLYQEVTSVIKNNNFPITVGGDHSLAIATALASNTIEKDIGIIWIDAHTDYNTIASTITGNIHGLPLAVINGHDKNELSSFLNPLYIQHHKTVIIGARSIDKLEKENLKKDNITVYTTEDIYKYGIEEIMNKAFKQALGNNMKLHISYDLDVIDPHDCPGVSIPEINGITKNQAIDIMKYLSKNKKYIKSLDLVEYNPNNDINNQSLNLATDLLNIFIDKKDNNI